MATPQSLGGSIEGINVLSSRLVWVLNRDVNPYKGTYRGTKVTIPANMEKIPLLAEKGGNLFAYLEGDHFVRDMKEPQEVRHDHLGKVEFIFGPKALLVAELTAEERSKIEGKNPADLKKEILLEEKKAKRTTKKNLDGIKNKILVEEDLTDE